MNEVCTWPFMCLCPTFQHELCNMTGNPHSDLFPNNNNTLEVDIYKGVCVVMCMCVWSHFQLWVFKRKHMDSHLDLNFFFFYTCLNICLSLYVCLSREWSWAVSLALQLSTSGPLVSWQQDRAPLWQELTPASLLWRYEPLRPVSESGF